MRLKLQGAVRDNIDRVYEVEVVEIDGMSPENYFVRVPPPSPAPQRWEVELVLCAGKGYLASYIARTCGEDKVEDERARVTLEFGDGWARVKPTERDRELARLLRLMADGTLTTSGALGYAKYAHEAADRLDGGEK